MGRPCRRPGSFGKGDFGTRPGKRHYHGFIQASRPLRRLPSRQRFDFGRRKRDRSCNRHIPHCRRQPGKLRHGRVDAGVDPHPGLLGYCSGQEQLGLGVDRHLRRERLVAERRVDALLNERQIAETLRPAATHVAEFGDALGRGRHASWSGPQAGTCARTRIGRPLCHPGQRPPAAAARGGVRCRRRIHLRWSGIPNRRPRRSIGRSQRPGMATGANRPRSTPMSRPGTRHTELHRAERSGSRLRVQS